MRIVSPSGNIELDVTLITIQSISGRVHIIKSNSTETNATKKRKYTKRDPEDNLGNVIATLDTYSIDRRCDFDEINQMLNTILAATNMTEREFFSKSDYVLRFCNHFGITLRECISILSEYRPDVFDIIFIKDVIKPLIMSIQKNNSKNGQIKVK